jgi:hypothetical protein
MPFEQHAAAHFVRLRGGGVRIGSMDLKIACIALVYNALVLSANLQDFQKVHSHRKQGARPSHSRDVQRKLGGRAAACRLDAAMLFNQRLCRCERFLILQIPDSAGIQAAGSHCEIRHRLTQSPFWPRSAQLC